MLNADMPHGRDCPYPIWILAFFEMIRPYHVGIRISGNLEEKIVRVIQVLRNADGVGGVKFSGKALRMCKFQCY